MMIQTMIAALLVSTVTAEYIVSGKTVSRLKTSDMAMYSCVFNNQWTKTNHPPLYPSSDAHWSPPLMASHDATYKMFSEGSLASMGVEFVAETGDTSILESELNIASVLAVTVGEEQFNRNTQSQTLDDITVQASHPMLSGITMVSPSPDWFTGFTGFDARNAGTQTWYKSFTITTFPYDAGTEQGSTYRMNNAAQTPAVPILELTAITVPSTGVFLNATATGPKTVEPVASWVCTLKSEPVCLEEGSCFSGIECCGSRCVNTVCLSARPDSSKSSLSLGSRAGLGGSAGRPINVEGNGSRGGTAGATGGRGGSAGRPINVRGNGRE